MMQWQCAPSRHVMQLAKHYIINVCLDGVFFPGGDRSGVGGRVGLMRRDVLDNKCNKDNQHAL